MESLIARLPSFDVNDDKTYSLNWCGLCRRHPDHPNRHQVFTRFTVKNGVGHKDIWVPVEHFPFLIIGSEWYRGIMVGKPLGSKRLTLRAPNESELVWHTPSRTQKPGRLYFGKNYRLAMDSPAAPVMELVTQRNEVLYLPLSELLRTHYFFHSRTLPSLLGGLVVHRHLASEGLEAWHYPRTAWIDKAQGLAQILRAKFIDDETAKRLARLLFSSQGEANLKRLRHWVEREFTATTFGGYRPEDRSDLPKLTLPYSAATWTAVTRWLGKDEQGRSRYLVLQLVDFDAAEPYTDLLLEADNPIGKGDGTGGEPEADSAWGKWLTPDPPNPLPIEDAHSDGRMTPVSLDDIIPVDQTSRRRRPIKPPPEVSPSNEPRTEAGPISTPVEAGSVHGSGPGGSGRAPAVFGSDETWPRRSEKLVVLAEQIIVAVRRVVDQHRRMKMSAEYQLLPSSDHAYSYIIPKSDSSYAHHRAVVRQFLVVQVRVGGRHAYVIEPERRLDSDSFSSGLWGTRDAGSGAPDLKPFTTADIEAIAQAFEIAHRAGTAWTASRDLKRKYVSHSIRHAPYENPTPNEVDGFQRRIVGRLMAMIGDLRVMTSDTGSMPS